MSLSQKADLLSEKAKEEGNIFENHVKAYKANHDAYQAHTEGAYKYDSEAPKHRKMQLHHSEMKVKHGLAMTLLDPKYHMKG